MNVTVAVTAGAVSVFLLEVIKLIVRYAVGNPGFDFPAKFYVVAIPVLNIIVVPGLAYLGFEGYVMPTDWQAWSMEIVRVLLSSLVSLIGYTTGLKPLKEYAKSR